MVRTLFLLWGLGITAGALWIRFASPQTHSAWFRAAAESEVFHVLAHTALYGGCAALALVRFRPTGALLATLGLAFVQEVAQVVGVRSFGAPELFDLGVDSLAATLTVLGALATGARRAG